MQPAKHWSELSLRLPGQTVLQGSLSLVKPAVEFSTPRSGSIFLTDWDEVCERGALGHSGDILRGVAVQPVTLSPAAGNNRWNQLQWESVWLSGGAVYRQPASGPRPDTGLRQPLRRFIAARPCRPVWVHLHHKVSTVQGLHMTLWTQWGLSALYVWWIGLMHVVHFASATLYVRLKAQKLKLSWWTVHVTILFLNM